jgi:hypothetical protein
VIGVEETATELNESIGNGRFSMVNMGNNWKITNVFHVGVKIGIFKPEIIPLW